MSTPITKVVRHIYVHGGYDSGLHPTTKEGAEDFERWLTQHEKELRESIAVEIEAVDPIEWALAGEHAGDDAARIARGKS